jgi:hypothetical protein
LILIEHNPLLYEQAVEMTEYISKSMSDAAKEAEVLLYSPGDGHVLGGADKEMRI